MDGTSRSVIISTGLSSPYALTIDYDSQTLYWADYSLRKIESASVTGANRTLITTTDVIYPRGISYHEGVVYWGDASLDRISSVVVGSPDNVTRVYSNLYRPYEIHVVSPERQQEGMHTLVVRTVCAQA